MTTDDPEPVSWKTSLAARAMVGMPQSAGEPARFATSSLIRHLQRRTADWVVRHAVQSERIYGRFSLIYGNIQGNPWS